MNSSIKKQNEIIEFWFGSLSSQNDLAEEKAEFWFKKDPQWDQVIKKKFANDIEKALNGLYDDWKQTSTGSMALILLLDQFTRNVFRNDRKAFAGDSRALEIALQGIEKKFDLELYPIERVFFYLPLEHSEDLKMQELSVKHFATLMDSVDQTIKTQFQTFLNYAHRHHDVIVRFGRFPHRNVILERESTAEELNFLQQPNSSF